MVIVVDWLKEISSVTFDFHKLTLQFSHGGTNLMLQGTHDGDSLRVIGLEILDDILGIEDPWVAHLKSIQCEPIEAEIPPEVGRMVTQNAELLQELRSLPP